MTEPTTVNVLAFTGTRRGMTPRQLEWITSCLENLRPSVVHHGGCIGADAQFHELCLRFRIPRIHVWQCNIKSMQAMLTGGPTIAWHDLQPPLDRNKDIVKDADLVVACPESAIETVRSGTWSTVRYAASLDKRVIVVKPTEDPNA